MNVEFASLVLTKGEDQLRWYESSKLVRRGFCVSCGSALFWHADRHEKHAHRIAIAMGSLDAPSELRLAHHIFVADKGDYYELADGLPQKQRY